MSKEKFIRGKKDDCNHVGLYHNKRQEAAAEAHLLAYLRGDFDDGDSFNSPNNHNVGKQEDPGRGGESRGRRTNFN